MAKTLEDLRTSREQRANILERLGRIPESILKHDKSDKAIDLMATERDYASKANNGGHSGKLANVFDVSGQSCRGVDGALSRFPQNIGRLLVLFYTDEKATVIDPFAGHNSRMELVWRCGRNYIGCDLSEKFMSANREIKEMLLGEAKQNLFPENFTASIDLIHGDSKKIPLNDAIGDFTITSPPYWDLEYYGDEPEQLGKDSYDGFLSGLKAVMVENHRLLKPESFCVWFVNDFRKGGRFYAYHADVLRMMQEVGFELWDTIIVDLGAPIRAAFAQQVCETRIVPKRHEYALVFRR